MPMVGGKKFDYSTSGFKKAKAASKATGKPMQMDKKKKTGSGTAGKTSMMKRYS